jgi:hypothetical protein
MEPRILAEWGNFRIICQTIERNVLASNGRSGIIDKFHTIKWEERSLDAMGQPAWFRCEEHLATQAFNEALASGILEIVRGGRSAG